MKKILTILVAIVILALVVSVAGAEGGPTPIVPDFELPTVETSGEMVNETPTAWFVEFSSKPIAAGGKLKNTDADKKTFYKNAKQAGLEVSERMAFNTLWNGVSVKVKPGDALKLASLPGVKAVYPVSTIPIPETFGNADPELFTALALTGADIAQSELGFTGEGIKVAVMDTGIDYDHPDLGGCFGKGCRVAYGFDFVGDAYDAEYYPYPSHDNDPDDCQGHGTHVAGIIGANGDVVGVAPEVTFGAYRVFGCEGSTDADIMIAAMERVLKDDMDILNMSIGASFTWPQYPTAQAANLLVEQGVVVVASIGNSGDYGLYAAGAPGLGEDVIGVASFDNTESLSTVFEVNGTKIPYLPMSYSPLPPTSGTEEIVYIGLACNDYPLEADPAGKVALISRGDCSFYDKAVNAINAGATGVVVHNSAPGNFGGTLGTEIDDSTPVVSISQEDGEFIKAQPQPTFMTWTDDLLSTPVPTAGLISSFSSYGLAPDLSLKPDIGAPGGEIFSTIPLEQGGYGTKGGTSMASPHVAGAVALLLEAHPGMDTYAVRDVLQNSADPQVWSLNPGIGFLDHSFRQGAGMLDIDDAILATTFITPGKIATGETEAGPFTQTLTIENNGLDPVTYDLDYEETISTYGVLDILGWALGGVEVLFDPAVVTVLPGESATIDATIISYYSDFYMYGGYIFFTPQDGGQEYSVPFAGVGGDYQAIEVLTPTANGFPVLGWSPDGVNFGFAGEGDIFTMEGNDIVYILAHLEHQAEMLKIGFYQADSDEPYHPVFNDETAVYEEYMPRNSTAGSFFAFGWDGTRSHSNGYRGNGDNNGHSKPVPNGDYYLVLSVLKANGDSDNPDHWETWTSPVFTIDRP